MNFAELIDRPFPFKFKIKTFGPTHPDHGVYTALAISSLKKLAYEDDNGIMGVIHPKTENQFELYVAPKSKMKKYLWIVKDSKLLTDFYQCNTYLDEEEAKIYFKGYFYFEKDERTVWSFDQ